MTKSVARLYEQFQPSNYDLQLSLDPDAMTFKGSVTIQGKKTGRPSERLTFHQKDLKITAASITKHDKKGDQTILVSRINNQNGFDEVRLHADEKIFPGAYTVTMEFEAAITRPMHGIYPCFFKHDGQDKKLIATQFESHHAREAFPCIDEPEAKATFDLTLETPDEPATEILANTPVQSSRVERSHRITQFETTPRMSAYLLAFVFGEMGYTETTSKDGIAIRAYATPDNVALTEHALAVTARGLDFFSDYFKMPYPLEKLDVVALPDFSVGAMENWGLITFREQAMIVDPEHASIESKQLVALVVCHELSHQWFGNLVTMQWWDDLWLNESFANMMEYCAVDALFPDWHIWEQFVSHEAVSAKRRDSLTDVQPIHIAVRHPDEISTIFDPSIVYAKGGTVLYMLLNHIGEDAFRSGLQAYFKKHAYGNTVANDLWAALSASSQQDIGGFMHNWVGKPGYPIVTVDWNPGAEELKLTQRRFLSDPSVVDNDDTMWQVPLAATYQLEPGMLGSTDQTVGVPTSEVQKPLLLNQNGHSYFVPHYLQNAHLQQIVNALKRGDVGDLDRFLLLDNYNMLQRGGVTATTDLLDLLSAYQAETSETVWGSIAMSVAEARKLVESNETAEVQLDGLIGRLVIDLAESLGWDDKPDDSADTLRLRGMTISLAAGAKVQSIIDEGLRRFQAFKKPGDLSPSTRSIVYYIGSRFGSQSDFDKLLALHESTNNADEKEEVASGLTGAKESSRYKTLLELLTSTSVRRQDLMHWYAWLLRNRHSRASAWQWMQDNWQWILDEFASDKSFDYFPRLAGSIFSRDAELADFQAFFEDKKAIVALARNIQLAEQEIASRITWRERNEAGVKAWLSRL